MIVPSEDVYVDGVLREHWDDTAHVVTTWDASGVQVNQRPYTAAEIAAVHKAEVFRRRSTNRTTLFGRAQHAITVNQTTLTAIQTVASRSSADSAQRNDDLQLLARTVADLIQQNNTLFRLFLSDAQPDLLDSLE